jgi:hypothetical protein
VLDKVDIEPLIKKYKGGGTSSFHQLKIRSLCLYQLYFLKLKNPEDKKNQRLFGLLNQ